MVLQRSGSRVRALPPLAPSATFVSAAVSFSVSPQKQVVVVTNGGPPGARPGAAHDRRAGADAVPWPYPPGWVRGGGPEWPGWGAPSSCQRSCSPRLGSAALSQNNLVCGAGLARRPPSTEDAELRGLSFSNSRVGRPAAVSAPQRHPPRAQAPGRKASQRPTLDARGGSRFSDSRREAGYADDDAGQVLVQSGPAERGIVRVCVCCRPPISGR